MLLQKIILDKQAELQQRMLEFNSERKEYTTTTLLNDESKKFELKTVSDFYQELIEQFKADSKCGNRLIYRSSYNSLKAFTNDKLDIPFSAIDIAWLNKYEKWLRSKGNEETTMSLMFRTLRSTYNKAIKAKCARKSEYPFDEFRISKFDVRTQKRAIAKTEVLKFTKEVCPIGKRQYVQLSKDIFMFSYLCEKVNHFIEANTEIVELSHLRHDCLTPVFSKDNELTISDPQFIEAVYDAATSFFQREQVEQPDIRCSHVVKGRTPEAIHKPANQLLESDKTIYYERCAFSLDIPTIYEMVGGNKLNLSIVGVRAYNQMNLYSKKSPELFRLAIGFKNQVCCNMCIMTTGYKDELRVSNTAELYRSALELFNSYNPAKHLHLMQSLGNTSMSDVISKFKSIIFWQS